MVPGRPKSRPVPWLLLAVIGLTLVFACAVPLLDVAGKECTGSCPDGLACVNGVCAAGGSGSACLQPDGSRRPGPDMVWIARAGGGGFCIDSTEVTNAQFNEYVVAGAPLVPPLPTACMNSAAPTPTRVQSPELANVPVQGEYLTFCYAWSYCQWASKRLCGALGDGGVVASSADPHELEWYYACANGAQDTVYPYGDDLVNGACNVGADAEADAEAYAACHGLDGGYALVFDLGGNVAEYVNNTDDVGNLRPVGPSYSTPASAASCGTPNGGFNGSLQGVVAVGFRCCADN